MKERVLENILIIFNSMKKQMAVLSKNTGYSSSFCKLLFSIDLVRKNKEHVYQKDLEEKLHLSKSGLSELIMGLENNQLIVRESNLKDSRFKEIFITSKGEEVLRIIDKNKDIIEELARLNIDKEDYDKFIEVLMKVKENLGVIKNEEEK